MFSTCFQHVKSSFTLWCEEICRQHGADRALRALRGEPEPLADLEEEKEEKKESLKEKKETVTREEKVLLSSLAFKETTLEVSESLNEREVARSGAWFGSAVDPDSE